MADDFEAVVPKPVPHAALTPISRERFCNTSMNLAALLEVALAKTTIAIGAGIAQPVKSFRMKKNDLCQASIAPLLVKKGGASFCR
jgi:hypothetical protein